MGNASGLALLVPVASASFRRRTCSLRSRSTRARGSRFGLGSCGLASVSGSCRHTRALGVTTFLRRALRCPVGAACRSTTRITRGIAVKGLELSQEFLGVTHERGDAIHGVISLGKNCHGLFVEAGKVTSDRRWDIAGACACACRATTIKAHGSRGRIQGFAGLVEAGEEAISALRQSGGASEVDRAALGFDRILQVNNRNDFIVTPDFLASGHGGSIELVRDVVHRDLCAVSRGVDLEVGQVHVEDAVVPLEAKVSVEGDDHRVPFHTGLCWREGKRTLAAFITGETNAICTPRTVRNVALDVAAERLLDSPVPGAVFCRMGCLGRQRSGRTCDQERGGKACKKGSFHESESP